MDYLINNNRIVNSIMSNGKIQSEIKLNWQDILWGYDNQLLGWKDVVNYANYKVIEEQIFDEPVIELSMINKDNTYNIRQLLKLLVTTMNNYAPSKWLYLILLDLYERKSEIEDPLQKIEEIHADFDYPEEMNTFIRYMPSSTSGKYSYEENINRIYLNWENYLITNKRKYAE